MEYFLCVFKEQAISMSSKARFWTLYDVAENGSIDLFQINGYQHYKYYVYSTECGIMDVDFQYINDKIHNLIEESGVVDRYFCIKDDFICVTVDIDKGKLTIECPFVYSLSPHIIRIFNKYFIFNDTIEDNVDIYFKKDFKILACYRFSAFINSYICRWNISLEDNSMVLDINSLIFDVKDVKDVSTEDDLHIEYLSECSRFREELAEYYGKARFNKLLLLR